MINLRALLVKLNIVCSLNRLHLGGVANSFDAHHDRDSPLERRPISHLRYSLHIVAHTTLIIAHVLRLAVDRTQV